MPSGPRTFKPRNLPCPLRCGKFFANVTGIKCHLHTHRRQQRHDSQRQCSPTPVPPQTHSPTPLFDDRGSDNDSNWEVTGHDGRPPSPQHSLLEEQVFSPIEDVIFHPIINGRPCDRNGTFLPANSVPPPWDDPPPEDFSPYESRADFELAELLYRHVQMPKTHISNLMQIWACKQADIDTDPPFANADDLYATIDATEFGDVAWQSFAVSYNGEIAEHNDAPWKLASYDVWFRDPLLVLKTQLSNRDFANEMDFAPKKVIDKKGKRRYQDFMSGQWAWRQADILQQDQSNHGSTFCPVILGSDKTTVSIATGQNEYYPLYMSNGLIHNNVRRAHRNGVSLIAFLAIPKTDREHESSEEFRRFRRRLFHGSLEHILKSLKPCMETPMVMRCADGHYRQVISGLGPYIGDYPEQVQLACVVQGWCSKCTAKRKNLDGMRGRRTHELTAALQDMLPTRRLWKKYGIIDGIMPFTSKFPRADIHELISPDILHQLTKGVFKDHLVTWVEDYIRKEHPPSIASAILAEIDRRIAVAPHFPGLRHFKEGRGFKQWTGQDSKALMKVYLPAIAGLIPPRMVRAVRYFLEFCYYVRRSVLDDDDLDLLDELLAKFHEERKIFEDEDVRPTGFNLPRQHALTHYRQLIIEFGAPNGLCSSITESKHIAAVKEPYRRSSRNQPLSEMILINQRMDKLAATRVNFAARGMLGNSLFHGLRDPSTQVVNKIPDDEDDDEAAVDDRDILGETLMARKPDYFYPRQVDALAELLNLPMLREDISRFLYEREHPGLDIPLRDIPIEDCPWYTGLKVHVFPSAIALYHAPSDLAGIAGMHQQRIRSTRSWRGGPERHDCVFVMHNDDLPGFRGMHVAQVKLFFKIKPKRHIVYPCALVTWFSVIGDEPCPDTGMWRVEPDFDANGNRPTTIIHLDSILRGAHLIGIAGENHLPHWLENSDSLTAFRAFYVNKFVDYHAHETIF